jgi:hypothetical protein
MNFNINVLLSVTYANTKLSSKSAVTSVSERGLLSFIRQLVPIGLLFFNFLSWCFERGFFG